MSEPRRCFHVQTVQSWVGVSDAQPVEPGMLHIVVRGFDTLMTNHGSCFNGPTGCLKKLDWQSSRPTRWVAVGNTHLGHSLWKESPGEVAQVLNFFVAHMYVTVHVHDVGLTRSNSFPFSVLASLFLFLLCSFIFFFFLFFSFFFQT